MKLRHQDFISCILAVLVAGISSLGLTGCGKSGGPEDAAKAVAPVPPAPPAPAVAESKDQKPAPAPVQKAPSPDEALAARVTAALAADARLKSFAIDVKSKDGVVDLFGTVDSRSSQDKAVKLAAAVDGVGSVRNHLKLVSGS